MKKRIILCADDYGQNKAISQAILELLAKKSLSAVSCLVSTKDWRIQADLLKPYINHVDIGLHFNLTFEKPNSLSHLLLRAYTGALSKKFISNELNAQLDQFIEVMERTPDFIDGHQHVHTFPIIRDVLIDVYKKRGLQCYVRSTSANRKFFSLKKWFIQSQLANAFKKCLIANNIPHNSTFSGIYDFSISNYRELFLHFLTEIEDRGIIMCHPGFENQSSDIDEIKDARFQEWIYFRSEHFQKDCNIHKILLTRFSNN